MGPRVRGDDIGLETVRLRRVRGFVSRTAQREGVARGIGDELSVHFAKQPTGMIRRSTTMFAEIP